jgi:hypothetical protein
MQRCLRRGRYLAAIVVAMCAMVTVCEYGVLPHELVEHQPFDTRDARLSWLRALWIGVVIVILGAISLVRFSRKPASVGVLPRAAIHQ